MDALSGSSELADGNAATKRRSKAVNTALTANPPVVRVPNPQPVEHFIKLALAGHPRIHSARARITAAANRVPQAQALEDPLLSSSFYPISSQALQTASGRAGNTLSLTQKLPWPEKLWAKAAIARRKKKIADTKLTHVQLEIEELVRLVYYELWFADRAIDITNENRVIAVQLIKLAEVRNTAGGSQQDVLRAQLQLDSLDDRLIALRRQRAVAEADLAALIQQPGRIGILPTPDIEVNYIAEPVEILLLAAEKCSPRLRERRWAVSRDHEKRHLASLGNYPDFMVGTAWQTISENDAVSAGTDGHDNISFMVGVTLPIWRSRINAAIREDSAEVTGSSRDLQDAHDDTYRQIRRLSAQSSAAYNQWQLYSNRVLPRARHTLYLAKADYRGQRVDFGEVANGFTEVLMFELQVAKAKATLAGTIAQLHRTIGCGHQTQQAGHLLSSISNAFSK